MRLAEKLDWKGLILKSDTVNCVYNNLVGNYSGMSGLSFMSLTSHE